MTVQQKLQSSQDHEVQNAKLKETLEEYKSEFAQVKNQGESLSLSSLSLFLLLPSIPNPSCSLCPYPPHLIHFCAVAAEVTINRLREKLKEMEGDQKQKMAVRVMVEGRAEWENTFFSCFSV